LSIIQDEIVKIGVENLGTEEGRQRFFDNLKAQQLIIDNATINDLLPKIESTIDDIPIASTQKFVNLIKLNDFTECVKIRDIISTAVKSKENYYINSLLNSEPTTSRYKLKEEDRISS
jgi:hypothetical protein